MTSGLTSSGNHFSVPAQSIGVAKVTSSAERTLLIKRLSWLVAVLAMIVQQGAFVSSPVLSNLGAESGSADSQANILNTLAIMLNIALIAPLCLLHYRKFAPIIYGNKAAIALIAFIFLSMAWSIHPDVTLRRSVNYFSTVLTACYLAGLFDVDEIMKILSWGIAITAAFSFLFVAAFPVDAIHQPMASGLQVENIAGSWRGVFPHKNVLGHAMTVGVIVELYILAGAKARTIWHVILLLACSSLVILSRSSTAIILATFYLLGAVLYFVLRRASRYFGVALVLLIAILLTIAALYWADPNYVFELLGSDDTLTGRTELWTLVLRLISERPLLGWGYSAMWLPTDNITKAVSQAVGWSVPQAHNALLEVTLELGLAGLAIVSIFVAISLWRSVRCITAGEITLGMLSLVFFLGIVISGTTEPTLAQNQNIEWVFFNVLSFSCGLHILRSQVRRDSPSAICT
jgi:exopolysaccharide production protein ExoQ